MYCKDFLTTYKEIENYEDSYELYKIQLMQIFKINNFDDKIIANENDIIDKELSNNNDYNNIKKELLNKYNNCLFDENNISILFFSYDYFDLFHKCYIKNDFSNFNI